MGKPLDTTANNWKKITCISDEIARGNMYKMLIFLSIDILAFAIRWSINPVPGINDMVVEGVQSWLKPKPGKTKSFQPHKLFPLFSIRNGNLVTI